MTGQIQISDRELTINFGARHGVSHWHSSPSPCSSPSGRGDGVLSAFVSLGSFFDASVYHRKDEIVMEFAPTSLLLWGEEQDEGVSCLRGGSYD